jgi:hypothetical protein
MLGAVLCALLNASTVATTWGQSYAPWFILGSLLMGSFVPWLAVRATLTEKLSPSQAGWLKVIAMITLLISIAGAINGAVFALGDHWTLFAFTLLVTAAVLVILYRATAITFVIK